MGEEAKFGDGFQNTFEKLLLPELKNMQAEIANLRQHTTKLEQHLVELNQKFDQLLKEMSKNMVFQEKIVTEVKNGFNSYNELFKIITNEMKNGFIKFHEYFDKLIDIIETRLNFNEKIKELNLRVLRLENEIGLNN